MEISYRKLTTKVTCVFFIITSGSVDVHVAMEDDGTKEKEPHLWFESGKLVASMSSGEIFGERAVLSNNPVRTASCVAKGQVKILKMYFFLEIIGLPMSI